MIDLFNIVFSTVLDKKPGGYVKLNNNTCFTQIRGSHSNLSDAMIVCDNMEDRCNGVQQVKCKGGHQKITKSTLKTSCKSEPSYRHRQDCNVFLYVKSKGFYIISIL